MAIYRPSELKNLLEQLGTHPKKRFSQNFLIDGNVIRKIADLAQVQPGDEIVEIGPGPGALTEELLARGARVLSIEKDRTWADALKRLEGDITPLAADVLACPLEETIARWRNEARNEARKEARKGAKVKLVANLPYHITTPILTRVVPLHPLFSQIIVMVQDEVAERYTSPPGSRNYGSITLFFNFWSTVSYAFKVKNTSFYPSPKVASALLKFIPKPPPSSIANPELFFQMTRQAFNQRRKMLKVSLKSYLPKTSIQNTILKNPILEKRPEALSLEEFIALFHLLTGQPEP